MDPLEGKMTGTLNLGNISTRQKRIAQLAREDRDLCFHSIAHSIDEFWLQEAFYRTRRDGAPGVDGQTWEAYAKDLGSNVRDLLNRFKSGRYRAPPVRRTYIPKGDGTQVRPIGIPTLEDKVLQRAVTMLLEPVYEETFLGCSYGYRPGRSAHDAVESIWQGTMGLSGGWVQEVDIRSFFDELDPRHLRSFLDRRVRDGVIRRTIDKWLKAGVFEEGRVHHRTLGTPQGGVISPLLANLYLHEVVDRWFTETVQSRLEGRAVLIRYADDMVFVFEREHDARRFSEVLPKRLARFGLRLHPEKTRLVDFRRPCGGGPRGKGPRSFDFLGFTHHWGRSRHGRWVVKRKTAKGRLSRSLRRIREWCSKHRHQPIWWQQRRLSQKLKGHYAYFGITGNRRALESFYWHVERIWRAWLNRRSQKARMIWSRFTRLLRRYPLPKPRIVHSYVNT